MKKQGTLFLLLGPSRVGKDSILRGLLKIKSLKLRKLVTMTTREKRPGEIAGKTYHFVSEEIFLRKIENREFLEWAPVRNHRFGTPRQPLLSWLRAGYNVVQQIDVRGAHVFRRLEFIKVMTIFILPGSLEELKQRLSHRHFSPEQRHIRWLETVQELKKQTGYDYRVVNAKGELGRTIREVAEIIKATSNVGLPR